ncbi:MAG: hypothetical protein AAB897_01290 [Patescibacteria group bacterium]
MSKKAPISPSIFKAYDIRGKYPAEVNETVVFEVARALGKFWKKGAVIIGHDARLSSSALYKATIRGLKENRVKVFPAGLITTPTLSFLVGQMNAAGGLMITASHNPKEYNGIKAVGRGASAMSGKEVLKILQKFR